MEYGNYFKDAFQKLSLLEQDFDISVDAGKTDELATFIADDREAIPEEPVFDTAAENEDELQDNYVGKVIIECECCHSKFYKKPEDVIVDSETQLANVEEECPFCNATMGYTVIGKIEPFDENEPTEDEVEIEVDDEVVEPEETPEEEEVEGEEETEEEEEVQESLRNRIIRKRLKENALSGAIGGAIGGGLTGGPAGAAAGAVTGAVSGAVDDLFDEALADEVLAETDEEEEEVEESLQNRIARKDLLKEACKTDEDCEGKECVDEDCDESLTEDFKDVSITTDDQHLEMTSDDSGKVTVTTEPLAEESITDEPLDAEGGQEEIVPLSDEDVTDIVNQSEEAEAEEAEDEEIATEDELEFEEPEAEEEAEGEEDEFDEFDEESFDQMGESYMRKVYDNIKSYKTTSVKESADTLIVEGLITFDSGNTKKTVYTFSNPKMLKGNKVVLEGFNKTFSKTKKAFSLKGKIDNKKFITESLGYHYITKKLNESVRVNGRVKRILV